VLSQLVGTSHVLDDEPSLDEVRKRIAELDERTRQYNEFGLVPRVKAEQFFELLDQMHDSRISLIEDVLTPYLDGQRARLDSLQPTEALIRTFVETVNGFLVNKSLSYTLRRGLRIQTDDGSLLSPDELSSGERQLLLLLCNSLLSRDASALFIIDEPEISLNAKWQRKLVPALLACVQSSSVQFVLATHSVEIITGHRNFLAKLQASKS
jgi:predicted ATP-dependent endonuclease of OLD family